MRLFNALLPSLLGLLLVNVKCGIKISRGFAFHCDEDVHAEYGTGRKFNCTNEIVSTTTGYRLCVDPGCPNKTWQTVPNDDRTLVCCASECSTYNCNNAAMDNTFTDLYQGTRDFGRTWQDMGKLVPTCPGGITKYCDVMKGCPPGVNTMQFIFSTLYCESPTCTGKLVLNREKNIWICQDASCEQGNMIYSSDLQRWVCQSRLCGADQMIFDNRQKR